MEKNPSEAVKLYTQAVEQGHATAMNNLADCYHFGLGVDKDLPKAVKLYTQAAEKGNASGMYNLAHHHEHGVCGLPVNLSEARRYYQMAADMGDEDAAEELARLDAADDD